eukprot:4914582-Pyramimonas_sp.AAC.1
MFASLVKAYTKIMLGHLARSRSVVHRGKTYAIGGHSNKQHAINIALSHMCKWVSTLVPAIQAEFPAWNILQAFGVLRLTGGDVLNSADIDRLRRFAQVFKINFDALRADILFGLPHAKQMMRDEKLSTFEVWKSVVVKYEQARSFSALKALLARHGAYVGCTTSGVEFVHSSHECLFTSRRGLDTSSENIELKL